MTPAIFAEANCYFGPPHEMTDTQVKVIHAYRGTVAQGSVEGSELVVTAWIPNETELAAINAGAPVFLSFMGGLPPHFVTTNFAEATNPS